MKSLLLSIGIGFVAGCTTIGIGKDASVTGTPFATFTADCANCDNRVVHIPAADHKEGDLQPIMGADMAYPRYVGDRAPEYAPVGDQTPSEPLGFIPQVNHTYAYWESVYPFVNEHGLALGESTCSSRTVGKSRKEEGGTALFFIGELMRVAVQRCKTAQCAVDLMGALAEKYGFYGEDPGKSGAGETLTVADSNEAWIFHVTGLPTGGAVWVAQRVPDNHIAVAANHFIIRYVKCNDADFKCSPNLLDVARSELGCDTFPLDFTKCFGLDVRTEPYMPGYAPVPHYSTIRQWRIHSLAAGYDFPLTDNGLDIPFSVEAHRKFTRQEIMNFMREHYEGTPYDMTKGAAAGPFGNPNRVEKGDGMKAVKGQFTRSISLPRTTFALVHEMKPLKDGVQSSVAWFAFDAPATSVFSPIFVTSNAVDPSFSTGNNWRYSRDSAWWAFGFVQNWMNIQYAHMNEHHVLPLLKEQQTLMENTVAAVQDFSIENLNKIQTSLQEQLFRKWLELGDFLIMAYNDGCYNVPEPGQAAGYPAEWLKMIGFNKEFYKPQWVKWVQNFPVFMAATIDHAQNNSMGFMPGMMTGTFCGILIASLFMVSHSTKRSVNAFTRYIQ